MSNYKIQGDIADEWWEPNKYQRETIDEFMKAGAKIGVYDHIWQNSVCYGYQRIEKMFDGKLYIGHPAGRRRILIDSKEELPKHNGAVWREDIK